MKFLYLILIFASINIFADEPKIVSSLNPDIGNIIDDNKKIILHSGKSDSTGKIFLENYIKKNYANVKSSTVTEIYSVQISTEWTGAIFDLEIVSLDATKTKELKKIFYNKTLAVEEIYNNKAVPMSRLLKLPLVSKDLAYNGEFLIHKSSVNKQEAKSIVIFSEYVDCNICKEVVPKLLDFATRNDMNIYFYNISNATEKSIMIAELSIAFLKTYPEISNISKIDALKKIFAYNFNSIEKNHLIREFNELLSVNLTLDGLKNNLTSDFLLSTKKISEKLYIRNDLTVYIDGVIFEDFEVL